MKDMPPVFKWQFVFQPKIGHTFYLFVCLNSFTSYPSSLRRSEWQTMQLTMVLIVAHFKKYFKKVCETTQRARDNTKSNTK